MNESFKKSVDFACSQKELYRFLQEDSFYFDPVRHLFSEKLVDAEDIIYLLSKVTSLDDSLSFIKNYWFVTHTLTEIDSGLKLFVDKFAEMKTKTNDTVLFELIRNRHPWFKKALEDQKIKPNDITYLLNKLVLINNLSMLTNPEVDRLTLYCLDNLLMDRKIFEKYYESLSSRRERQAIGISILRKSDLINSLFLANFSISDIFELKNVIEEFNECQALNKEEQKIRKEFDDKMYDLSQKRRSVEEQIKKNTSLVNVLNDSGLLNQHTKDSLIDMLTKERKKKKCKLNL